MAVIACQLVVHCRLQTDMGILQKPDFEAIVRKKAMQLPYMPGIGSEAVLLKTGYEAHKLRQRPPAQAMPAEMPKTWAWAEKCRVEEVCPFLCVWMIRCIVMINCHICQLRCQIPEVGQNSAVSKALCLVPCNVHQLWPCMRRKSPQSRLTMRIVSAGT